MLDLRRMKSLLQDRRVWAVALSAVALIAALTGWSIRMYHRAEALQGLNEFPAFQNPALEVSFPQMVIDSAATRTILEPGVRQRLWTLHPLKRAVPALEVRLTSQGQRWFSVVNHQIIATFKAGTRQATRILELEDIFPRRQVRFRFRWTHLQSASAILGPMAPEVGKDYEGEGLFLYENDRWRLMHWTTPAFEEGVGRFRSLQAAPH